MKKSMTGPKSWYPRYVGAYMADTQELSMVEHGAYALLMDYYYTQGRPPADIMQLHRICRALACEEQAAVHKVVQTYFVKEGDRLVNTRCEEELLKRSKISKNRKKAARNRWSKTGDASAYTSTDTSDSRSNVTHLFPGYDVAVFLNDEAMDRARQNANGIDLYWLMQVFSGSVSKGVLTRPRDPNKAFPSWVREYVKSMQSKKRG